MAKERCYQFWSPRKLALTAMDGQTMGHFVIIAFILFGNVVYIVNRRRKARA